jgi:hypothetical protein
MKASRWHQRVTGAEFDVDRFPRTVRVVEKKIGMAGIKRVHADELETLGR